MYDAGKIIAGLVVFIGIITYPIWGSIGDSVNPPKPVIKTAGKCVESAEFMKANHMQMLEEWRQSVVRDSERVYVSKTYGTMHDKSLSSTGPSLANPGEEKKSCMGCHPNKEQFCDSCHDYASVDPYCWSCHIEPKESI
ncbi:MAG: cytochrome C [Proteobacteria bacterium]|nr:cytochrome C [Pseudomonadota bacterium]